MVLSPALMVFISGGICIANCPYAFYKERELTKIPTLRSMNNKLREDANRLEENVDELSSEIDILEPEADRAAKIEGQLREIADQQQVNVDKLVELVKENEIVLAEMRVSSVKSIERVPFHPAHHRPANNLLQLFICQNNLRKRIVQDIISIVVKSDKDNDQKIDNQEAKELALKIRLQLQEYDVDFDSQKFIKVIAKDPSVPGVIAIVQKLLPAEEKKKEVKVDSSRNNADYMTDSDEDSEDEEESEMYGKFARPF